MKVVFDSTMDKKLVKVLTEMLTDYEVEWTATNDPRARVTDPAHVLDLDFDDLNLLIIGTLPFLDQLKGDALEQYNSVKLVHVYSKGERLNTTSFPENTSFGKVEPKKRQLRQLVEEAFTEQEKLTLFVRPTTSWDCNEMRSAKSKAKSAGFDIELEHGLPPHSDGVNIDGCSRVRYISMDKYLLSARVTHMYNVYSMFDAIVKDALDRRDDECYP